MLWSKGKSFKQEVIFYKTFNPIFFKLIFFTKILDTLGTVLERQPYFAPKLGRDMATLILQYGEQRCFLIRSRSTANDAHEAPYVKGIKYCIRQ